MSLLEPHVIGMLVDCFDLLSKDQREDVKSSLRTRARNMPAELLFRGLSYVLVLCASRGNLKVVEKGLQASSCKELLDAVKDLSGEKAGYALYGAILLLSLRKQGAISEKTFSDVVKNALDNPIRDSIAYGIAEWIRKLAESYLEEEKKKGGKEYE